MPHQVGQRRRCDALDGVKVSLITAVHNGEATLERCLNSVAAQTHPNIELIVVDALSSDRTPKIVEQFGKYISKYIREADEGISDAWNKGLSHASGQIVAFLNADDYYDKHAVRAVVEAMSAQPGPAISYGVAQMIDDTGYVLSTVTGRFEARRIWRHMGFMHTTCFATKSCFDTLGGFDTSIRIAGDTDWLIRAHKAGISMSFAGNVTFMQVGGISQMNRMEAFSEYADSLIAHGATSLPKPLLLGVKALTLKIEGLRKQKILRKIELQTKLILVALANLIIGLSFFFVLKRFLLRVMGMKVGKQTYLHRGLRLLSLGHLTIGDNVVINRDCVLDNRRQLSIGNNVSISPDVTILTLGHDLNDPLFRPLGKPVTIEDNAVIFNSAMIMPGVTVGKNAVILSGAVVTKDVPAKVIVGGNPARPCGERNVEPQYRLKHNHWFG